MKKILLIALSLNIVLLFISCDTPINEYKPKSDDEKQIIALLNTYVEARNSGNLKILRSTFHDNGIYISGRGREIKANKILDTKPEWWTSDGDVKLYEPKITINGNKASVMTTAKYGSFSTAHIYTLINENGNWLIMKVE
jgi:hypothetical protein